jgi:hypothetical protein
MPFDYYKNIDEIDITPGQVSAQLYQPDDINSMDVVYGYMQNPAYGQSEFDRVELHVYDVNKNLLFSDHRVDKWSTGTDLESMPEIHLDINSNVKNLGFTTGVYDIVYNFHRDAVGGPIGPKFKILSISNDRTEVRLVPSIPQDDTLNSGAALDTFYSRFQQLKDTSAIPGPFNYAAIPNNPLWTAL